MALTQTERAARLGISANYLSMIYHGKRKPGLKLARIWYAITGMDPEWWAKAKVSQIQKILDAVE
jgi:transcriptional regulator with XRE-family HTH domain